MASTKKRYVDAIFHLDQAFGALEIVRTDLEAYTDNPKVKQGVAFVKKTRDQIDKLAGKMEKHSMKKWV